MKAFALRYLTACLLLATAVFGQDAQPSWESIMVIKIKPEMRAEYEGLVKNELNPALKKGGLQGHHTWQTVGFGDLFEYVQVSTIHKFADLDGPSPLVKALDQNGADKLIAKLARCVTGATRFASRMRPDLSIMPSSEPKLAMITSIRVTPGRRADYDNWLKNDYLPALRKGKSDGYIIQDVIFGGETGVVAVGVMKDFAAIDAGPTLTRAVGPEEAAKITAKVAGVSTIVSRTISRYRPDLSFEVPKK